MNTFSRLKRIYKSLHYFFYVLHSDPSFWNWGCNVMSVSVSLYELIFLFFLFLSFDTSFLSDTSFECFSTNPETGLVHVCRRSPRLLANGYYVLTEDSVVTDDHGNLTLTPTQTNISYKENLARSVRVRNCM